LVLRKKNNKNVVKLKERTPRIKFEEITTKILKTERKKDAKMEFRARNELVQ